MGLFRRQISNDNSVSPDSKSLIRSFHKHHDREKPKILIVDRENEEAGNLARITQVFGKVVEPGRPTLHIVEAVETIGNHRPDIVLINPNFDPIYDLNGGVMLAQMIKNMRPATINVLTMPHGTPYVQAQDKNFDCILKEFTNLHDIKALLDPKLKLPKVAIFDDVQEVVDIYLKLLDGLIRPVNKNAVSSAEEAMRIVREHNPDIVMTDLFISRDSEKGIREPDGFEIHRETFNFDPKIVVFLDTSAWGREFPEISEKINKEHFDRVFHKGDFEPIRTFIEQFAAA